MSSGLGTMAAVAVAGLALGVGLGAIARRRQAAARRAILDANIRKAQARRGEAAGVSDAPSTDERET